MSFLVGQSHNPYALQQQSQANAFAAAFQPASHSFGTGTSQTAGFTAVQKNPWDHQTVNAMNGIVPGVNNLGDNSFDPRRANLIQPPQLAEGLGTEFAAVA